MPTTQPTTLWTPEAVVYVAGGIIGAIATMLIPAIVLAFKQIGANTVRTNELTSKVIDLAAATPPPPVSQTPNEQTFNINSPEKDKS